MNQLLMSAADGAIPARADPDHHDIIEAFGTIIPKRPKITSDAWQESLTVDFGDGPSYRMR